MLSCGDCYGRACQPLACSCACHRTMFERAKAFLAKLLGRKGGR
jgi:hypothetical protein